MIIALLALLGVSLWVIAALILLMLFRRRWLSRQPGAFRCAMREVEGDLPRIARRWRRGWARRSKGVIAWDPLPTLVGSSLLEVVAVVDSRPAERGEVRRMGDGPVIARVKLAGNAAVEIALRSEDAAGLKLPALAPVRRPPAPAGSSP